MTFTLGVRGSDEEGSWTSHLAKFGLAGIKAAARMQDLVTSGLNEHLAIGQLLARLRACRGSVARTA